MLGIEEVENYIPEEKLDVENQLLSLNFSKPEAKVFKKIYQLQQIPKEIENSFLQFISKSLIELFNKTKITKNNIKYLIHAHTGRVVAPFGESLIREIKYKFGLSHAQAFSVSLNNCASIITAISIIEKLLSYEEENARAIIVTADMTFTPILQVIPNVSVMGDAVASILFNQSGKNHQCLAKISHIYGRYAAGGWMSKDRAKEFEENYVPMILETIQAVLNKVNLTLNDIKLILPHNVNYISWEKVRSALGISKEKIYLKNISRYGHCFGADIFINYKDALKENIIKPNDFYMMVTVGLGATVSAAIFKF